jgi:hypothetical protein
MGWLVARMNRSLSSVRNTSPARSLGL